MEIKPATHLRRPRTTKPPSPKMEGNGVLDHFFQILNGVTFNTGRIGYIKYKQCKSDERFGIFFDSCSAPGKLSETHVKQKVILSISNEERGKVRTRGIEITFRPTNGKDRTVTSRFDRHGETFAFLLKYKDYQIQVK